MTGQNSSKSVLSAVRSLLPQIAAAAEEVDRTGVVDSQLIRQLHDAGYFSLLQSEPFGGLESGPDIYLTATRELSSACTSTGWLAGWLAVNNWGLSVRDERVLQEIWGEDPRALLCSSYAPTGRLEAVDGGFRLSGRWTRCTGAHHSSWLSVAALLVGSDGAAQDFVAVLVPRTDYSIESTWNGLGLRGIGADDVVVSGAFVPRYRSFSWLDFDLGSNVPALDRLPQPTVYTLAGTIPLIGAAQRVVATRPQDAMTPSDPVAMARTDLELSVLQIHRNVSELLSCVRGGDQPDTELVLRTRRDQVMAADRAVRAVSTIVQTWTHDTDDVVVERISRDMQTARMHVSSNVEQVLSVVGRFALGLEVDDLIW